MQLNELMGELTERQKQEVLLFLGEGGGSLEGVAFAIEMMLKSYDRQREAAQDFFYGRFEEGFEKMDSLPFLVKEEIGALIFETTEGISLEQIAEMGSDDAGAVLATAIMESLDRRLFA